MARRSVTAVTIDVYETSNEDFVVHPEVSVMLGDLMGPEGNAFVVLGRAAKALESHGIDPDEYRAAARAGDYEHLLGVTRNYMRVFETGEGRPQDQ